MSRPIPDAPDDLTPADRLRLSLEMFEYGRAMMRENLRRAHPDATDEAIEDHLLAWLRHRPGAEHGDGVGAPGTWPRGRHG